MRTAGGFCFYSLPQQKLSAARNLLPCSFGRQLKQWLGTACKLVWRLDGNERLSSSLCWIARAYALSCFVVRRGGLLLVVTTCWAGACYYCCKRLMPVSRTYCCACGGRRGEPSGIYILAGLTATTLAMSLAGGGVDKCCVPKGQNHRLHRWEAVHVPPSQLGAGAHVKSVMPLREVHQLSERGRNLMGKNLLLWDSRKTAGRKS